MAKVIDVEKGKCPLNKMKKCDPECVLFRTGIRYFDDPQKEPEPFKMCGINVLIDANENQIMRTIGLQAEMNRLRNNVEKTVQGLLTLGQMKKAIEHEVNHKVTETLLEHKGSNEEAGETIDVEAEV